MELAKNNLDSNLLKEMKKEFTEEEQVVFANNFYMYLNYHPTEDFVIDLDDVYEMIGFIEKGKAKRTLENNFIEDEDYKILFARKGKKSGLGRPEQKIMLNTDTFKNLCMIARTEKAKKIRIYYVKLENINMKLIKKSNELVAEKHKMIGKSEQIMEQFDKKPVVYLGLVEKNDENQIIKYGHTGDIKSTLKRHKCTYGEDFSFVKAIECRNRQDIEKKIQNHNDLVTRHVKIFNGNPRQELIRLDTSFDVENLAELILKLQQEKEESVEVLVEKEKTKQIEAQEKTKQMQIELEILKLQIPKPMQTQIPVQKVQKTTQTRHEPQTQSKPDDHSSLVKKYIELATEHSIRNADNVLIEDLHSGYETWHSKEYPNGSSVSKTIFVSIIGKFTEYTKKRIPIGPRVNNVTPRKIGIVNRKFKT